MGDLKLELKRLAENAAASDGVCGLNPATVLKLLEEIELLRGALAVGKNLDGYWANKARDALTEADNIWSDT